MRDYRMGDSVFSPQKRQFVGAAEAVELAPVSDTLNLVSGVKDAAGATGIERLKYGPIYDNEGLVGTFWGDSRNKQWEQHWNALVKTDGSADITLYNANYDLEELFEGNATARYVVKAFDSDGNVLYGWVGGVAKSTNLYTFSIYSDPALGTQNWFQGDATAFSASKPHNVQIFRYASSITLGSSDTLTEEVAYNEDEGLNDITRLKDLTDGQYMVDYENARVLFRKADADDTETVTYKTLLPVSVAASVGKSLTTDTQSTTTAGGAVALVATSTLVSAVTITAPLANTDLVYIGDSSLDAGTPTTGHELVPGGGLTFENVDLNDIYMDVLVDAEDVVFTYTQ